MAYFRFLPGIPCVFLRLDRLAAVSQNPTRLPADEATATARGYRCSRNGSPTTRTATCDSCWRQAVKSHLVADVPVGVFLSSGLDSTAIAALASRAQKGIHTFTVAFPDVEFSEAETARRTAKRLGTQHQELDTFERGNGWRVSMKPSAGFDQPSMDGINTYFVSWAARQAGLKVALSGLGSDELFGGYTSFRFTRNRFAIVGGWLVCSEARFARMTAKAQGGSRRFWRFAGRISEGHGGLARCRFAFRIDYFFTRLLFTPQTVALVGERMDAWRS